MNKSKMIAVGIILFLFIVPFHWAYMHIEGNGGIVQALSMAVIIIAAVISILIFNNSSSKESH